MSQEKILELIEASIEAGNISLARSLAKKQIAKDIETLKVMAAETANRLNKTINEGVI